MSIHRTFRSLRQRLTSSATLQPLRRVVWILATAALLGVFGAVGASAGKVSSRYKHRVDQRLNVVVILSDDERWDGTTVMQNVKKLLVNHGVNFTNAHVTTSMCGPSRASILTGQYAHHTGVLDNFGRHGYPAFHAGEESNDLAVWMHAAGYKTGSTWRSGSSARSPGARPAAQGRHRARGRTRVDRRDAARRRRRRKDRSTPAI